MPTPIVALGASAGGLEAMCELFSALPPTTGAAFVVAQHLDREHKSLLAELLAKKTTMPVAQIEDGLVPMPNKVFVIPANQSLTLVDNHFQLAPCDAASSLHHPVDVFFASSADLRAGAGFGNALSSAVADGAIGVNAVNHGGGMTIASLASARRRQQPHTTSLSESEKDRRIAQLEHELESTRELLQMTLEAQEAAQDDPKSANQELAITNEELLQRNRELSARNAVLTHTRAYAEAIVSSIRTPLLVLDRELRVLRGSPAFYEAFGLSPEVTEGTLLRELDARQWDLPELLERLGNVLGQDIDLVDQEVVFPGSTTAEPRIFRIDANRIPGDAGRVELILFSIEDVTERRSHADALERASQRKDEFLAMLAHELRNPLTPITHAIHLLQRESFNGPPAMLYSMIERQTRRLVRLVDDLLDLARINRGHIELRNALVDLNAVVQDAGESVRFRMETRRHEMKISMPSSPVYVDGDAVRLEQVVSNLLENAAKYTNPGGRIEVSLTEERGQAVLRVRDNGIGLATADLEHIFVLFDQVDRSMTRSGGGLGIGLTLVRRVLELHRGSVEARSAGLGCGTEFIVHMPLSAREESNVQKPASGTVTAVPTRRRSVLIVDDHVDAVETMRMLAQHWGHDVSIAHSGPEAIAAVASFHPEIALIDIGLPGITGYDVASVLRQQYPEMLLVAMTGHGRDEDQKAAYVAGFDAHLVKPLNLDELQAFMSGGRVAHALVSPVPAR